MSRYRGPRIRIFKRLGYLPGFGFNRKFQKFKFKKEKKKFDRKSRSKKNKRNTESFTIRLKEKQKLRYNYGLTEKKLVQYVQKARKKKNTTGTGAPDQLRTGQRLFNSLEMRLDNIVFQLGFGETLPAARQLIAHGHIFLNGQKRDIPSSQCQPNDIITLARPRTSVHQTKPAGRRAKLGRDPSPAFSTIPTFLSRENLTGKINQFPSNFYFNQLLVIEYYSSRKGRNG